MDGRSLRGWAGCGLVVWACAVAAGASAQTPPPVESQHAERVATEPGDENDVRLALTASSALTYGNARTLAINLGADLVVRLDQHALTAQLAWVYGLASLRDPMTNEFGDWVDSTNNLTWRLRYDLFLTRDDALFLVHRGRRDPFAALRPRLGFQLGYARSLFREDKHRLWVEVGYDFTYDRFGSRPLPVGTDQAGMPIESTDRTLHSLRLFLGYENRLNEVLTYVTGFEGLMRFDRPEHWRFEWINQLRSKLADWLQISLDLTGRLDSLPPGQVEAWNEAPNQPTQMLDVLVTLNFVGTFDLYSEPSDAEEAEEECEEAREACEECVCPPPSAESEPAPETEAESGSEAEPDASGAASEPEP